MDNSRPARRGLKVPRDYSPDFVDRSLREEQHDADAKPPAVRAALRAVRVVPRTRHELDELAAHLSDLAGEQAERDGPLLGLPVVGRIGGRRQGPPTRPPVGREGLQERTVDIRSIIIARERPDVIRQRTEGPRTLLLEREVRGSSTLLVRGKQVVTTGRQYEQRADAPDPATIGRRFR